MTSSTSHICFQSYVLVASQNTYQSSLTKLTHSFMELQSHTLRAITWLCVTHIEIRNYFALDSAISFDFISIWFHWGRRAPHYVIAISHSRSSSLKSTVNMFIIMGMLIFPRIWTRNFRIKKCCIHVIHGHPVLYRHIPDLRYDDSPIFSCTKSHPERWLYDLEKY